MKVPHPSQPGVVVDADVMDVIEEHERWNEYLLLDGTKIRVKHVLLRVLKLNGVTNPDGSQVYQAQTQLIVTADEAGEPA